MSLELKAFQVWLNHKGASPRLSIDGVKGPATRAAILNVFVNTDAPAITTPQKKLIADRLGATVRQLEAVMRVEAAGAGWDNAGRLKCLWERHYLWRRIRFAVPLLSNPKPGGYTVDADGDGINDSWEKLADASMRWGPEIAFECASFGKPQIMGAWWDELGYPSSVDFVWQLLQSEFAHYDAFARYVEHNGLTGALRAIDGNPENARAFAKGYNGSGYAKHGYHVKIADKWRLLR